MGGDTFCLHSYSPRAEAEASGRTFSWPAVTHKTKATSQLHCSHFQILVAYKAHFCFISDSLLQENLPTTSKRFPTLNFANLSSKVRFLKCKRQKWTQVRNHGRRKRRRRYSVAESVRFGKGYGSTTHRHFDIWTSPEIICHDVQTRVYARFIVLDDQQSCSCSGTHQQYVHNRISF